MRRTRDVQDFSFTGIGKSYPTCISSMSASTAARSRLLATRKLAESCESIKRSNKKIVAERLFAGVAERDSSQVSIARNVNAVTAQCDRHSPLGVSQAYFKP